MKTKQLLMVLTLLCVVMMLPVLHIRAAVTQQGEITPQTLTFNREIMVPAPYLASWLGAALTTDQGSGRMIITWGGIATTMQLYSTSAAVGRSAVMLPVPVVAVAGVTYVPLNPIAQAYGVRVTYNPGTQLLMLTHPVTGVTADLPVRGQILTTTADFNGDGEQETTYGAYLNFFNPYNRWAAGASLSNPALPRVWVVRNNREIWGRQLDLNEIAQLGAADLTGDGRPDLLVTTRLYGADYVGTHFHAYHAQGETFSNLIGTPQEYLSYTDDGGLLIWQSRRPIHLVLFKAFFDENRPRVEGPIGLQVTTYTWQNGRFTPTDVRRTTGTYSGNAINTLRTTFNIPVSEQSALAIRQGQVAVQ